MQNVVNEEKIKNTCNVPTMLTINRTMKVTGLSKTYLRKLISDNKIVYLKVGNRFLINVEKLVEYLNGESNAIEKTFEDKGKLVHVGNNRKAVNYM